MTIPPLMAHNFLQLNISALHKRKGLIAEAVDKKKKTKKKNLGVVIDNLNLKNNKLVVCVRFTFIFDKIVYSSYFYFVFTSITSLCEAHSIAY